MTQGEIGLKIYYVDEEALSSPPLLSSSMAIKITEPKKVEETPLPLLNITRKLKQWSLIGSIDKIKFVW